MRLRWRRRIDAVTKALQPRTKAQWSRGFIQDEPYTGPERRKENPVKLVWIPSLKRYLIVPDSENGR